MPAKAPIDFFRDNLGYARDLVAVARAVDAQTTKALDTSDILRAALVMGVSAMDHYVHEKVRVGMIATHASGGIGTPAFSRFEVSMSSVQLALSNIGNSDWLDNEIRERHGLLTFQKPDKVADAIRLISPIKLWEAVALHLSMKPEGVKRELTLIVDRRNKIAHEADVDPTPPHERWPIDYPDVDYSLDFIDGVTVAIEGVC